MDSDQLYTWPYKDLVEERIPHIEETFIRSGPAAIEGRGLLKGPHTVYPDNKPVLLLQGWLNAL